MRTLITYILLLLAPCMVAQDLDSMLNQEMLSVTQYAKATFKASRLINGHTVEIIPKRGLDLRVAHRFGNVNDGLYESFGADDALSQFSLEYGLTDNMMFGIGKASYKKTINGFYKIKLLRQSSGSVNMPVSLTYYTNVDYTPVKFAIEARNKDVETRFFYTHQLLLARKFNSRLSLQIMPTFVHRNMVLDRDENNDLYCLGVGGKFNITTKSSFNVEYFYVYGNKKADIVYYNPFSFGFDIQQGGHVFQLHFTNAVSMTESGMLGDTHFSWLKKEFRFGFNLSKIFQF